ncbi:MAG: c(7)-type cytochrome triheme domain-containing protein [Desulfurivibrionaceae bacterium]
MNMNSGKKMLLIGLFAVLAAVIALVPIGMAETFGVKRTAKKPQDYGNVQMDNFTGPKGVAPVVFKHWLHRARYTCRLCHVDLGFAMSRGGTRVTEGDIRAGLYCGACHNGKTAFAGEGTRTGQGKNCDRCHSYGKEVTFSNSFAELTKGFPRARFGNRVDWLKAEELGLLTLKDEIPGLTIKRKSLKKPEDMELRPLNNALPDIIFSHEKHATWNGCELCHPDLFGVKKGASVYTMQDIFGGRYCGACHDKVAFPNMDCQLCHTKEVS